MEGEGARDPEERMREERRQFIRVRSRLTTFVKCLSTGRSQSALTRDVGGAGACLLTKEVLEPGTPVELEIKLPDRTTPIICTAEVVWSQLIGDSGKRRLDTAAETGVKFVRIDSKDRLLLIQYARLNAMPESSGQ